MPISAIRTIGASAGSSNNATGWVPLNLHETPFNVSFGVYVSGTGQPTVRVEHTFHDVMRDAAGADAFIHEDVSGIAVTSASNTLDGNYAFPIRAARAVVASSSGNATVHFRVLQAGI